MQYGILDWILEQQQQQNDNSGKTEEIQIKSIDQLIVL